MCRAAGGFSLERSTLFGIDSSAATSDLIFTDIRCLLLGTYQTCRAMLTMSVDKGKADSALGCFEV
jgi:hypothetical protein